jgi:beta-lactamase class A
VEERAIALDQPVRFLPQDRILPSVYSPLQDKFPAGNVDISVEELLRLSVLMSDNVAADVLLRLIGGPTEVNSYIAALGVNGFHLETMNQRCIATFLLSTRIGSSLQEQCICFAYSTMIRL